MHSSIFLFPTKSLRCVLKPDRTRRESDFVHLGQFADTAQCIIEAVIVCPYNTAPTGGNMKNAIFATIAVAVICTAGAVAQDQNQDRHDQQATSHRVRKATVKGYVRKDGDNYVVEDDRDKTRYRVQNTEAIREHERHPCSG
jgi:hypothetical protein